ncbi:MAG: Phosphate transport system permease protein PstC [Firmicutes bacterium ADurb.Bin262]|nr:MAG: Phosphate transport system permease protein PstC [Firmicutes bacterium ADurb.Bin262]
MKKIKEEGMRAVFFLCACISVVAVALICIFLFAKGIPAMKEIGVLNFLLGRTWKPLSGIFGILPMIVGSIYVTAGAVVVGVPLGIMTAVFMAWYCPKRLYGVLKPAVNLLAGIPSVVYGFFGLMVIVPAIRNAFAVSGASMLAASLVLGIMILPTVIGISEAAIRAVPEHYYEGARALGASIGETMAVIMVAGNQAVMPTGVLKGLRTLTANIVIEMGYSADLHREALIATGVVLFVFILMINLTFSLVQRRSRI